MEGEEGEGEMEEEDLEEEEEEDLEPSRGRPEVAVRVGRAVGKKGKGLDLDPSSLGM